MIASFEIKRYTNSVLFCLYYNEAAIHMCKKGGDFCFSMQTMHNQRQNNNVQ